MRRDSDPTPAHGIARPGVAYVIRRGPRFDPDASRAGKLAPGGEYWQGLASASWGAASTARYYTSAERDEINATGGIPAGAVWQEVLIEIPA